MRLFVIAFCLLAAGSAYAQPRPEPTLPAEAPNVLTGVYACADISDDEDRLECFDTAVGRLQQAQTQGEFAAVDRAQVRSVQREGFGFNIGGLARLLPRIGGRDNEPNQADEIDSVELVVERVVARANGYHAFVMTNGSIWTQVVAEGARNVRPGQTVTVRQAMMSSYMLSSGSGSAHRVRREQ